MLRCLYPLARPAFGVLFLSLIFSEQAVSKNGFQLYFLNSVTNTKQQCDGAGVFKTRTNYYAFVPARCIRGDSQVSLNVEQNGVRLPLHRVHYSVLQEWEIFGFQPVSGEEIDAPVANSNLNGFAVNQNAQYPRLVRKRNSPWGIETAIYQYQDSSGAIASGNLLKQVQYSAQLAKRQAPEPTSAPGSGESTLDCNNEIPLIESSGTTSLDLSGYKANGVNPGGVDGALDSCIWSVIGGAENDPEVNPDNNGNYFNVDFGQTDPVHSMQQTGRRFRLGLETDGTGINQLGGLYYYQDPQSSQRAIWVQPLDGLFTPGEIKARFKNNTSETLNQVEVKYRIYRLRDQSFQIRVRTGYSINGGDIDFRQSLTTAGLPADSKVVSQCYRLVVDQINLPANGIFVMHWHIDDDNGMNKRDEVAIGSVQIARNFAEDDQDCLQVINPVPTASGVSATSTGTGIESSSDSLLTPVSSEEPVIASTPEAASSSMVNAGTTSTGLPVTLSPTLASSSITDSSVAPQLTSSDNLESSATTQGISSSSAIMPSSSLAASTPAATTSSSNVKSLATIQSVSSSSAIMPSLPSATNTPGMTSQLPTVSSEVTPEPSPSETPPNGALTVTAAKIAFGVGLVALVLLL